MPLPLSNPAPARALRPAPASRRPAPSSRRILVLQPFLGAAGIGPMAGGKDYAAREIMCSAAADGHEVFLLPWPLREHAFLDEHLFQEIDWLLDEEGRRARVLSTMHIPRAADLVAHAGKFLQPSRWRERGVLAHAARVYRRLMTLKARALEEALRRCRPEVLHCHQTDSDAALLARSLGYTGKLVLTHFGGVWTDHCRDYDQVIFCSRFHRERVLARAPELRERSTAIPLYAQTFAAEPSASPRGVLFVGLLKNDRKGLSFLLDAYAREPALHAHPLHVVGEGAFRAQVEKRAEGLPVHFHGALGPAGVARLYGQCALFALPSRDETFGMVYAEALCSGLPIVGYPPCVREFGEDMGQSVGQPFDPESEDAGVLARRLLSLLNGEATIDREVLRTRARSLYSAERFRGVVSSFYATL